MSAMPQLTPQTSFLQQLQSAAVVFLARLLGLEVSPVELAQTQGVARSTTYRQAQRLWQQLQQLPLLRQQLKALAAENLRLHRQVEQLQNQLAPYQQGHWIQVTPQRVAMTTLELAARGDSVETIQATLGVAFAPFSSPSAGTLCAIIKRGAQLAEQLQLRALNLFPLDALELDELFHANKPILLAVEPYSMAIVLLEMLGNCRAHTWKFAFDYRNIEPPAQMTHDCSMQGNLLVKLLDRKSQLCVWHRMREIDRELRPQLAKLYEKSLEEDDELLWQRACLLEAQQKRIAEITHLLDFEERTVRRYQPGCEQLLSFCEEFKASLQEAGMTVPSLSGLTVRRENYLTHLLAWDTLAREVEFIEPQQKKDGFYLLDALAAVFIGARCLETVYEKFGDSELYWHEQHRYLQDCERLRKVQAQVKNNGYIQKKFHLLLENSTRTTSRVEALNRRLRGFTDAKRHVTEGQLRLMELHHNTTPFAADAKRAGKSPWQWLGVDVEGLQNGFVGVLTAANGEHPWPSTWELKA